MTGKIDIGDLTKELCERLGVDYNYCWRIDIDVSTGQATATAYLYQGKEGRCKGEKFAVDMTGEPVEGRWAHEVAQPIQPATETVRQTIVV